MKNRKGESHTQICKSDSEWFTKAHLKKPIEKAGSKETGQVRPSAESGWSKHAQVVTVHSRENLFCWRVNIRQRWSPFSNRIIRLEFDHLQKMIFSLCKIAFLPQAKSDSFMQKGEAETVSRDDLPTTIQRLPEPHSCQTMP